MSKKQSSVEWLYNTIDDEILNLLDGEIDLNELSVRMLKIKEQAKEMHKNQLKKLLKIIDWYDNHGDVRPDNETYSWFIQLWNETFKGQE